MKDSIINSKNKVKPKEEIIVKKERVEYKIDGYLKEIIDKSSYSDFLKEYAQRRQNYKRSSLFNTVKDDLKIMIKDKRLIIYTNVSINKDYTRTNKKEVDIIIKFEYTSKELNRKSTSKTIYPDFNEENYYIWFNEINNILINDCSQFNRMESMEIKKLIGKAEEFCQIKFDKLSSTYLVNSGVVSATIIDDILNFYKEKKDQYIIEYIDRKILWKYPTDNEAVYESLIQDLDYMLEKGRLALPLSFNLLKDQVDLKYKMVFNKRINNVDTFKNMTVYLIDLNENELKRIWVNLFEFLKFIYSERIDESQREKLFTKIDNLIMKVNIDKYTENYLVENSIVSKTSAAYILELYNNKNSLIVEWLDRRMDLKISNDRDTLYNQFLMEIEYMTQLKRHTLPATFNIYCENNKMYQMCLSRKINGKQYNKYVTVNLGIMDKFECFRMWELIFEWMTKVFGVLLSQEQLNELKDRIQKLQEIVSNSNDDESEKGVEGEGIKE